MECWVEAFERRGGFPLYVVIRRLWLAGYPTPSETLCLIIIDGTDG